MLTTRGGMCFTTLKQMPLVIGILVLGRQAAAKPVLFIAVPPTRTAGILRESKSFDANARTMTSHIQPCAYGQITDSLNHIRYFCFLDGLRGFFISYFFQFEPLT